MSEIQYWINQNGVQAGPVTRDELQRMQLTGEAYVWRSGMADWVRITEMSELAGCYQTVAAAEPPIAADNNETTANDETSIHDEPFAPAETSTPEPMAAQPMPPAIPGIPAEPMAAARPAMPQAAMRQPAGEMPKCPPTNLVWAIISTLLCCLPLGVVAIIYSAKVSQKYNEGDLAAAEHYSEVSAWWCIGAIVGGIILSPFVSLIQMALMG